MELAAAEKLDRAFVSHQLRLTLLSPEIVEAILEGEVRDVPDPPKALRAMPLERARQELYTAH